MKQIANITKARKV